MLSFKYDEIFVENYFEKKLSSWFFLQNDTRDFPKFYNFQILNSFFSKFGKSLSYSFAGKKIAKS